MLLLWQPLNTVVFPTNYFIWWLLHCFYLIDSPDHSLWLVSKLYSFIQTDLLFSFSVQVSLLHQFTSLVQYKKHLHTFCQFVKAIAKAASPILSACWQQWEGKTFKQQKPPAEPEVGSKRACWVCKLLEFQWWAALI